MEGKKCYDFVTLLGAAGMPFIGWNAGKGTIRK
jgi:hypothetical protein